MARANAWVIGSVVGYLFAYPMLVLFAFSGLGLRRLNQTVEVVDTPAVRGLIRKVRHLVTVEG